MCRQVLRSPTAKHGLDFLPLASGVWLVATGDEEGGGQVEGGEWVAFNLRGVTV